MTPDESGFSGLNIAVVGLGLMGGSLAMGLNPLQCSLSAVDPDADTRQYALENGIVEMASEDPVEILPQADVIILAAPVDAILTLIPALPDYHQGSPIVLDLGSTKVQICQALSALPDRFETLGGHPMCGKAVGGIQHADPYLYQGATFAFTLLNRTTTRAQRFAERLAETLGAFPIWLGPDTHDRWVAHTSHLPYLISSALALATLPESSQLIGPGYLSVSRLASSPPGVMLPILKTNRDHVLSAIKNFQDQLETIEVHLRGERYSEVNNLLNQAKEGKNFLTMYKE